MVELKSIAIRVLSEPHMSYSSFGKDKEHGELVLVGVPAWENWFYRC